MEELVEAYKREVGKTASGIESVIGSEKSSEACEPSAEKSRYCFVCARTVNRHRWMRRES